MKNLKKFAALLLAGAMALLMLTACGGGGSVNNPEEQKVLNQIGSQKGVQVTNDAQLRAVAKAQLDEDLNGQFNVLGYAGAFRINKKQVGNDLAIVITARYDYQNTLLNMVLTEISRYVDTSLSLSALRTTTVLQVNNNSSSFPPECGCKAALRGFFVPVGRGGAPDDLLIPVEGILLVAFQRAGAVVVAVHIDKAVALFQLCGGRAHQVQTAQAGITSVSLLPPGLTALRQ